MTQLFRSLIFVPGNNPRFLEKAKSLQADIVCLDLEDSVPDSEKTGARRLIRNALELSDSYLSTVFVRTNSPVSGLIRSDLDEIVQKGLGGIVVPKIDDVQALNGIAGDLAELENAKGLEPVSIIPSIESAKGVVNTYKIASFGARIPAVVFGVFDLLNDLGVEYAKDVPGIAYSRAKIPVDARAAGVAAIDAIWQDLRDSKGFEDDCQAGKSLGYSGKSIIHPDQIETVHRLFYPTPYEIMWARRVCQAYLESAKGGTGATTVDGRMIDEVHFKQARTLLDLVGE